MGKVSDLEVVSSPRRESESTALISLVRDEDGGDVKGGAVSGMIAGKPQKESVSFKNGRGPRRCR